MSESTASPFHVVIRGGGIAGQVLQRELTLREISSEIEDHVAFPRNKVCGGILQADSWDHLQSIFTIESQADPISHLSHFWKGKHLSRIEFARPMVFITRLKLDNDLQEQQNPCNSDQTPPNILHVDASGGQCSDGEWLGFQAEAPRVFDLQMHYGRGIYLGLSPTLTDCAHAAFLIHQNMFKTIGELPALLEKELEIRLSSEPRGTGRLKYGYRSDGLAIGDAKLMTHPFLGLGMKHAIESARLMAKLISLKIPSDYDRRHRKRFWRYNLANRITARLFHDQKRLLLWPVLRNPVLFRSAYRFIHEER